MRTSAVRRLIPGIVLSRELYRQIKVSRGRPGTPERQRWNASATLPSDYDYGDPGPPSSPEIEAEVLAWRRVRGSV